jgi:flagellar hook-associated protein 2
MLRSLNRQIRSFLTSSHANPGSIQNLPAMGIKLKADGKLEIDEAALTSALNNNPDDVKAFLAAASGFAAKVTSAIDSMTQSIDVIESRLKITIEKYTARINTMEVQLALREESLVRQFAATDQAISQLNSQANALNNLGSQFRLF